MQDMDDELFFSTSQAAAEWGISQQRALDLCKAGLVDCETTQGGHYRISDRVVQKHKTGGLPLLPRRLPQTNGKARDGRSDPQSGRHDLLAPPSDNLVASREQRLISEHEKTISENEVTIVRNKADKLQAEWDLLQVQDKIEQRDQAKTLRAAEVERQQKRPAWMREWIRCAVDSMPEGSREEYEPAVVKAVKAELAGLSPDDDDAVVQSLMDATVRKALREYYWLREAAEAVEFAKQVLPSELRNYWSHLPPTEWEDKAVRAASLAICTEANAGDGEELNYLPIERMEKIALVACAGVVAEYQSQLQAQADIERRRQVKERVAGPLYSRLDRKRRADADRAIDRALAVVPPDAEDDELAETAQAAVAPLRHHLDEADEQQRQRDEQERRRSSREWAKVGLSLKLPYGFPNDLRDQALAAMSGAVDVTNTTDSSEIDAAIQDALRPFVDAHERRKEAEASTQEKRKHADERRQAAERRIDRLLLDTVDACMRGMEQQGRLKFKFITDRVDYEFKVKGVIRPGLVDQFARITNLHMLGDEAIKREIGRAARYYIERHLPGQVA